MTHAEYAENLAEHLADLETRLKAGRYRAMSVKRRRIAKPGSSKMRPLGIPVLEDKIVQQAVKMMQLDDDVQIPVCGASVAFQVAEPSQPTPLHDLEWLHQALA
ncbi:MAG: hypothetical protein NTW21_24910 [Verrucomicrobia bacterium]|nr:hypothetical protein [Verrucomicrobiota bacterium]